MVGADARGEVPLQTRTCKAAGVAFNQLARGAALFSDSHHAGRAA